MYGNCGISHLYDIKTWGHMDLYLEQGADEGYWICQQMENVKSMKVKCVAFSVLVLSHALVTPNFRYVKLLHAHSGLKQAPLLLHVKRPSYSYVLPTNSIWTHYSGLWSGILFCMILHGICNHGKPSGHSIKMVLIWLTMPLMISDFVRSLMTGSLFFGMQ